MSILRNKLNVGNINCNKYYFFSEIPTKKLVWDYEQVSISKIHGKKKMFVKW